MGASRTWIHVDLARRVKELASWPVGKSRVSPEIALAGRSVRSRLTSRRPDAGSSGSLVTNARSNALFDSIRKRGRSVAVS
jgi:hypothetical protein